MNVVFSINPYHNTPIWQKKQEIRAKKPVKARITGLFGTTMTGHKFKPLIIGYAKKPRAFCTLHNVEDLPWLYNHSKNAWMTADIFRDWYLNSFLLEVGPFIDKDMQIQFLIDNCSAHTPRHPDEELWTIDPNICIKMLPPNTTSLIQPMDQAVLACVKLFQKRCFYFKLLSYCESNHDKAQPFQLFKQYLTQYTILEAIEDINKGWEAVPVTTLTKSFRNVFDMEVWDEVCGNTFEGFTDEPEEQHINLPTDNLPLLHTKTKQVRTQVTNADFKLQIKELTKRLNSIDGLEFQEGDVIEDVLLNPGPTDGNIDNITREVLNVEDETCPNEDMIEDNNNVPVQQCEVYHSPTRNQITRMLHKLSDVKYDDLTDHMAPHQLLEWKKLVTGLENVTTAFIKKAHVSASDNEQVQVASTSGITRDATTTNTTTTTTTTILTSKGKKYIDKHSDEVNTSKECSIDQHSDDLNTTMEFLANEIVSFPLSESCHSLPELEIKPENQDEEAEVTVFRALSPAKKSKKSSNKFERCSPNSTYEVSSDSDEYL